MWKLLSILVLIFSFASAALTLNAQAIEAKFGLKKDAYSQTSNPVDQSEESDDGSSLASAYEDHVELNTGDVLFQDPSHLSITHLSPRLEVGTPPLDLHRPPEA